MGAAEVRDHISLPQIRHLRAVEAELGLLPTAQDALVIGPENLTSSFGSVRPYGAFYYAPPTKNEATVPQGPKWIACRFYASVAEPPAAVQPLFPVKTAHPVVKQVDHAAMFRPDNFGSAANNRGPVVLLPLEDVSVYTGAIKDGSLTRTVVLRCLVLTDWKKGVLRANNAPVGGGIFLGIGDFTFSGSPGATNVSRVLGTDEKPAEGWMIYMY